MSSLAKALEADRAGGRMQVIEPLSFLSREEETSSSSSSSSLLPRQTGGPTPLTLGYYRQSFVNVRSETVLEEAKALLRLLGQGGGPEAPYLVVDYVMGQLRKGANQTRRMAVVPPPPQQQTSRLISTGREEEEEGRGGGVEVESRVQWALERLPLVFMMNHMLQGTSAAAAGEATTTTLPDASRLFLEGLFLTDGGVWHLPTGQPAAAVEEGGGGGSSLSTTAAAPPPSFPVEVLDCNARLIALLVEGVGDCCEAVAATSKMKKNGRRAQERCLMLSLFPLVEKLGDPHPVVRQAALTTLHRLAQVQGVRTVGELLAGNLDYLVEALCARVRKTQGRRGRKRGMGGEGVAFPLAPAVLESLIAHAGENASVALVRELARVVLDVVDVEGLELGPRYAYGMMRVLRVMSQAVQISPPASLLEEGGKKRRQGGGRQIPKAMRVPAAAYWKDKILAEFGTAEAPRKKGEEEKEGEKPNAEAFFKGYHQEKEKAKAKAKEELEIEKLFPGGGPGKDEEEEEAEEEEEPPEEDDKPTVEEALVLEIIERCCAFLACPSLFIQHQVLAILRESLLKLAPRRVVLLPTVHKVWPAVMTRLRACAASAATTRRRPGQQEEDLDRSAAHLLVVEALEMVTSLADLCGDFLSFKFTEELWPVLRALLAASAAEAGRGSITLLKGSSSSTKSRGGGVKSLLLESKRSSPLEEANGSSRSEELTTPHPPRHHQQQRERQTLAARAETAVVRCLQRFVATEDCYRYAVPLVYEMGQACLFLLGRAPGNERLEMAMALFRALARLDGAALWPLLMGVGGWDISTRPPKAVGNGSGGSGVFPGETERKYAQHHARLLLKLLLKPVEEEMAWCVSTAD